MFADCIKKRLPLIFMLNEREGATLTRYVKVAVHVLLGHFCFFE
jgi:hypothetical protein